MSGVVKGAAVSKAAAISTDNVSVEDTGYKPISQGKKAMLTEPVSVTLLKDWGDLKKGEVVELYDLAVIEAGLAEELFKK